MNFKFIKAEIRQLEDPEGKRFEAMIVEAKDMDTGNETHAEYDMCLARFACDRKDEECAVKHAFSYALVQALGHLRMASIAIKESL